MSKAENVGQVFADFVIVGPKGRGSLRLLVDTGSTYTWIRASLLEQLGIAPMRRRAFRTITGDRVHRSLGEALIEFRGERARITIVHGGKRHAEVFGLTALETLGLEVDPIGHRLKRSESLLALGAESRAAAGIPSDD